MTVEGLIKFFESYVGRISFAPVVHPADTLTYDDDDDDWDNVGNERSLGAPPEPDF